MEKRGERKFEKEEIKMTKILAFEVRSSSSGHSWLNYEKMAIIDSKAKIIRPLLPEGDSRRVKISFSKNNDFSLPLRHMCDRSNTYTIHFTLFFHFWQTVQYLSDPLSHMCACVCMCRKDQSATFRRQTKSQIHMICGDSWSYKKLGPPMLICCWVGWWG